MIEYYGRRLWIQSRPLFRPDADFISNSLRWLSERLAPDERFPETFAADRPTFRFRDVLTYQFSSCLEDDYLVEVVDNGRRDFFASADEPNPFILFRFDQNFYVSSYSLRTYSFASGACHLKKWRLIARKPNGDVVVLDERECDTLNERDAEISVSFQRPFVVSEMKLQAHANHAGTNHLVVGSLHFDMERFDEKFVLFDR
jgi:hypothetical protein